MEEKKRREADEAAQAAQRAITLREMAETTRKVLAEVIKVRWDPADDDALKLFLEFLYCDDCADLDGDTALQVTK